jgi:hypothetical protein
MFKTIWKKIFGKKLSDEPQSRYAKVAHLVGSQKYYRYVKFSDLRKEVEKDLNEVDKTQTVIMAAAITIVTTLISLACIGSGKFTLGVFVLSACISLLLSFLAPIRKGDY